MKTLITGASGFFGSNFYSKFSDRLGEVTLTDKNLPIFKAKHFIQSDINSFAQDSDLSDYTHVFHFSGLQGTQELFRKDGVYKINNDSFHSLLKNTSCDCSILLPSQYVRWLNVYSSTSLSNQILAVSYNSNFRKNVKVVKLETIFGPGQRDEIAKAGTAIIVNALKNSPIRIYGDGNQILKFQYIDDVSADLFDIGVGCKAGTYNLRSGVEVSLNDFCEIVINMIGSHSEIVYEPIRSGEANSRNEIITIDQGVDYYGNVSEFRDTVRRTVEYYTQQISSEKTI